MKYYTVHGLNVLSLFLTKHITQQKSWHFYAPASKPPVNIVKLCKAVSSLWYSVSGNNFRQFMCFVLYICIAFEFILYIMCCKISTKQNLCVCLCVWNLWVGVPGCAVNEHILLSRCQLFDFCVFLWHSPLTGQSVTTPHWHHRVQALWTMDVWYQHLFSL